ncbi:uncharacterized protein LY89DRAFT_314238, partial [Mollisia scopiformis]
MESWRLKDDLDLEDFGGLWLSHPTSRNGRICGVNPESVGEMTLDQGEGTDQFT